MANEGNDNNNYTVKEIVTRLEIKVDKVLDDHESRIRILERVTTKWSGVVAFVIAVAALTVNFIPFR